MPVSTLSAVERVARVLAAERLSVNAEGEPASSMSQPNTAEEGWRRVILGRALLLLICCPWQRAHIYSLNSVFRSV